MASFSYNLPFPSNVEIVTLGLVHGRVRYSLIRFQPEYVTACIRYSVGYGDLFRYFVITVRYNCIAWDPLPVATTTIKVVFVISKMSKGQKLEFLQAQFFFLNLVLSTIASTGTCYFFSVQPNKYIECFCVVRCRPSPVWAFRDQMINHMVVVHGMAWLADGHPAQPGQPGHPAQRPPTPRVARGRNASTSSGIGSSP